MELQEKLLFFFLQNDRKQDNCEGIKLQRGILRTDIIHFVNITIKCVPDLKRME